MNLGPSELLIPLGILIIILIFGARRIGDIGKGLGEGIRNFKKALKGEDEPRSGGDEPRTPGKP